MSKIKLTIRTPKAAILGCLGILAVGAMGLSITASVVFVLWNYLVSGAFDVGQITWHQSYIAAVILGFISGICK
jgi:uncharacterized membrane protein